MIGNAVATLTGARAYLDPLAALLCVVLIELAIRARARRPLRLRSGDPLALQMLDMTRIGFSYGLLLEGFKLL
jgi:hypothetical protein